MVEFLKEFWQFLMERKKWWLIPIVLVLLLLGILLVLTPAGLQPFIYPIFG